MMRNKYLFLILLSAILIGTIFYKQISTHFKIALFITEEFPQIPVKPLGLLTFKPEHKKIERSSINGKIVADLYIPKGGKNPAVILAMGVKTAEKDKPLLLHFSDTMARLGYVVFWPRLNSLEEGQSLPEEPETFIKAFKYLESLSEVDKQRISYVGFSVGSSTAFVAVSDSEISDQVYSLVFFGGQFNIFEYLLSLASKSLKTNGERVKWMAADGARDQVKSLLEVKEASFTAKIFEQEDLKTIQEILSKTPEEEKDGLKKYSPKEYLSKFKAKIFILHDKSDAYVPYTESVVLYNVLPKDQVKAYHISDLFEHVQPNRPINFGELVKLYGFLYKVFTEL